MECVLCDRCRKELVQRPTANGAIHIECPTGCFKIHRRLAAASDVDSDRLIATTRDEPCDCK